MSDASDGEDPANPEKIATGNAQSYSGACNPRRTSSANKNNAAEEKNPTLLMLIF